MTHHLGPAAEYTPRLGARLVQEGNRLHYLADRASITGMFSDAECRKLDDTFRILSARWNRCWPPVNSALNMPTASPCTTTVSPAKPTPLAVAATYTSPFTPLSVNYLHESKHENFTCNNSAGGEALLVTRSCLANVTDTSAGTALWSDTERYAVR